MGMTPRCAQFAGLLSVALALSCGSRGQNSLDVGSDEGGPSLSFGSDLDASGQTAFDAHIEQNHVTVTFVTLGCTGRCADVVAVPTGGHAPYAFKWEDGSTSASRQVCPTSSTSYVVAVTDTGTSGELGRSAETVHVPLEAKVIACPDGGTAPADAGAPYDAGPALLLNQTSFQPFTGITVGVRQGSTTIYWADWQSTGSGTVSGVLSPPSGPIQVTFTGGDIYGAQTSAGTSYWTPAATYISQTVANAPPGPGLIEINGGASQADALTFSEPVTNPVIAIVSLGTGPIGSATLNVGAPFSVLSSGIGYQGSGLGSGLLSAADGGVTGVEGNGVIEVAGTF
jgi:hypothetical protein